MGETAWPSRQKSISGGGGSQITAWFRMRPGFAEGRESEVGSRVPWDCSQVQRGYCPGREESPSECSSHLQPLAPSHRFLPTPQEIGFLRTPRHTEQRGPEASMR